MQESGHYSIAGFYFQLLATADDALKVFWCGDEGSSVVFTIEHWGQDASVEPLYPKPGEKGLIQYKYSSKGNELAPNDLREILVAFKRSLEAAKWETKDTKFVLTTNRKCAAKAKAWFTNQDNPSKLRELLHDGVKEENKQNYPHTKLVPIFEQLIYDERDLDDARGEVVKIGHKHGMLEDEVKRGIPRLLGLLMERAASPVNREVDRIQLLEALVGFGKPLNLTGKDSTELQAEQVNKFRRTEIEGAKILHRPIYADIMRATAVHPFLVIHGEGGVGKSVAVHDAVRSCLKSRDTPPAFTLIAKAADLTKTTIQESVAYWRNQVQQQDGVVFSNSIRRLMNASSERPIIALYLDGIDEKSGNYGLGSEPTNMLRELIDEATASVDQDGIASFCIVVTCRTLSDLQGLGGGGHPLSVKPHDITVRDFDREELVQFTHALGLTEISERIEQHLKLRDFDQPLRSSPSARAVDDVRLEMVRHPMLWRCFSQLDEAEQHAFLDGDGDALTKVTRLYFEWFFAKVERRIGHPGLNEARTAMCVAARPFVGDNSITQGNFKEHWIEVCRELDCPSTHRVPIFEEAITTSVFEWVDENRKIWKWKRPWACEYLANEGQDYA